MKLTGFGLQNFRSIGNKPVVLTPWRKCNILVGQNNAGKSNVLKAVQKISDRLTSGQQPPMQLSDLDFHRRSHATPFGYKLYFESDPQEEIARFSGSGSFFFDFRWESSPTIADYTFAHIDDFDSANRLLDKLFGERWSQRVPPDCYS